ncbi:IS66 family insertion sequence element accessory protein TnpA [Pseudoalteromonas tunicata]
MKWRYIIDEQQASNLTIADFCQQSALSKTTFYAVRNKLTGSSNRERL